MTLELNSKRVFIAGLGVSGEAAARCALERGAGVIVWDAIDSSKQRARAASLDGAEIHLGGEPAIGDTDLVIVSPGIPPHSSIFTTALNAGIPVWSEIELAFRLAETPIIAVSGTNGKTTTTEMITEALDAAGLRAMAAGNIGVPLVDAATAGNDVIVAEVSSFQLHSIDTFRPRVAVLLNIAEDHLDWHGSFAAYAADKARIFANQLAGDAAVIGAGVDVVNGRGRLIEFSASTPPTGGAGVSSGWIVTPQGRVCEVARLRVRGRPNLANAVAAAAAACGFGADPAIVGEALVAFAPRPHRMEEIAVIDGVVFVNDSKATNPHATLAALEGMHDVILIAGGRNKDLDLSVLGDGAPAVGAVVAIGESAPEIEKAFTHLVCERATTMDDAVQRASRLAIVGATVLLSPACASFDMFDDYKHRGEAFRTAVARLTRRGGGDK